MVTTSWKCPECETVNDGEAELCVVCGGARAAAVPELAPAPLPIKTELGYVTPYTSTAVAENALALHALRKKLRLVCVIAAVLIVAACSWGVVLYNRNLQLSDRLSASVMQVDTLEEQCETLTADCEAKDKEIAKQNSTISSLRSEKINLRAKLNKQTSELNFYEEYAGIVPDGGSGASYYHVYGCLKLGNYSFWIYNANAAIQRGYKKCPYCH